MLDLIEYTVYDIRAPARVPLREPPVEARRAEDRREGCIHNHTTLVVALGWVGATTRVDWPYRKISPPVVRGLPSPPTGGYLNGTLAGAFVGNFSLRSFLIDSSKNHKIGPFSGLTPARSY